MLIVQGTHQIVITFSNLIIKSRRSIMQALQQIGSTTLWAVLPSSSLYLTM